MSVKEVWRLKIGESLNKESKVSGTTCIDCKKFKDGWCKSFGMWISPKAGHCELFKKKGD